MEEGRNKKKGEERREKRAKERVGWIRFADEQQFKNIAPI